ncbi:pilus assembly protein TadE [Sphingopyxis lindanitolerans]|uniref:Pilus assembly protein TadE n=1 Tax=Sphingopyxis lindanitolerans TaxID=2054227 RepID=A0A2S8B8N2_9SPHN|nr:TadE family protein [Sphingopyxis lindanitolerans]PQM28609.1 pilus assembly protein TadE [Sphingopyxis lindanitolerans]
MSPVSALLRRLRRHERGVALVEFALTAPVFLLILMGIFDYCWQMYAQQVLQGVVAKAGRDATIEIYANDQSKLDAFVSSQVRKVFKGAEVSFKRRAYDDFSKMVEPRAVDYDGDGVIDCVEDGGKAGNGGADDVILYTASMRFKRVLPVWRMLGQSEYTTLSSTTVLRNQPFAAGSEIAAETCG